jgi:hypothetical protein
MTVGNVTFIYTYVYIYTYTRNHIDGNHTIFLQSNYAKSIHYTSREWQHTIYVVLNVHLVLME